MNTIDFVVLQPLVNELVLALLTALASVVAAKACQFLKAKRDGELGQILDKALGMGIAFATAKLDALEAGRLKLEVKSELVAEAANYALVHVPEAAKALGLDGEHLTRMIEARLQATEPAA
ncbi:MAG: hypothetical protein K8R18_13195 [Parvibaculum sp.]|uniref:hypothetical protein n=1 Tax=Parvibaculum sp. TaxID=2024848 RepID=UPI0026007F6A|nr:hypothetical protein [Parvibaculum sp.]MCE9650572.1 hypothetical protein [Parvibaculum sp.]